MAETGDVLDGLLDLLFPPHCNVCGTYGTPFCAGCRARIEPAPMLPAPPGLAEIVPAGSHVGPLRDAVLQLKFAARLSLAKPLGELIATLVAERSELWQPEALVPVPIHWTRRLRRGFNQSEVIGAVAGRRLGLGVARVLVRSRRTRPQVGRSADERLLNVAEAFRVRGPLKLRRVVLIDDVCTTGATLGACATALRSAGAEKVYAVTVTIEPPGAPVA